MEQAKPRSRPALQHRAIPASQGIRPYCNLNAMLSAALLSMRAMCFFHHMTAERSAYSHQSPFISRPSQLRQASSSGYCQVQVRARGHWLSALLPSRAA